jgi:two-component system, OmpR family, sensor histidine kinase KdpD
MTRGTLRIYLGVAPGAGTTYAMLSEGRRRAERGSDVVVAFADTRGRARTAALLEGLEIVAPARAGARSSVDLAAVLARHPGVALVDDIGLRLDPADAATARWHHVEVLLDDGVDVVATIDIRNVESLADVVERIVGERPLETVSDEFLRRAEQIELVDATPEALNRRLAHGNIAPPDRIDAATLGFYRPGTILALRQLALLWLADRVEDLMLRYMDAHEIDAVWETRERVAVAVTGAPGSDSVIRRAARIARRSHAELVGVHVMPAEGHADGADQRLRENAQLVARLGGRYHEVVGEDVAAALIAFAQGERATQLVIGATRRGRWERVRRRSVAGALLRDLPGVDVHVIAAFDGGGDAVMPRTGYPRVPQWRSRLGWVIASIGLPLLTMIGLATRSYISQSGPLLAYLLLVALVATVGGAAPAITTAIVAALLANWFFTPPMHTLRVSHAEDFVALIVFVSVAAIIAALVGALSRRTAEAKRARAEAEALARSTGVLVGEHEPLMSLLVQLRATFGLEAVSLLSRDGESWRVESAAGHPIPDSPAAGESLAINEDTILVLNGARLDASDRRLLRAFAAQLGTALVGRRLQAEAANAALLADANELRNAMLQSVSHDLRTPLASIKASVTSLMSRDVEFSPFDQQDLLETIDEESDRLDRVVGNLLDMSRLQANVLRATCAPTAVEDVVGGALSSIGASPLRVVIDIDASVPLVWADPVLLERTLANLLSNALAWSPSDEPVRVAAVATGTSVVVRVSDSGPGIPMHERARAFDAFQRLGDRSSQAGVGLGLAVSRGFILAMGGEIELHDTPGGGLSVVISLKQAPGGA